jgi:hypothetical protein
VLWSREGERDTTCDCLPKRHPKQEDRSHSSAHFERCHAGASRRYVFTTGTRGCLPLASYILAVIPGNCGEDQRAERVECSRKIVIRSECLWTLLAILFVLICSAGRIEVAVRPCSACVPNSEHRVGVFQASATRVPFLCILTAISRSWKQDKRVGGRRMSSRPAACWSITTVTTTLRAQHSKAILEK